MLALTRHHHREECTYKNGGCQWQVQWVWRRFGDLVMEEQVVPVCGPTIAVHVLPIYLRGEVFWQAAQHKA